tara:strand:- start:628 stop:1152 length:525 start_codon:yes stop_codon:yes gene_type:complete
MQLFTRKGNLNIGYRIMNKGIQGCTYAYELSFSFIPPPDNKQEINFADIKNIGFQWIDDKINHGMVLNPKDNIAIKAAKATGSKIWLMSLNGEKEYCDPLVENITKELYLTMQILFNQQHDGTGIEIEEIKIWKTPNCYFSCNQGSIEELESKNFSDARLIEISNYLQKIRNKK